MPIFAVNQNIMKKILLLLLAVPLAGFAQEKTISGYLQYGNPWSYGASYEFHWKQKTDDHFETTLINLAYATARLEDSGLKVDGSGFIVNLAHRMYLEKDAAKGLYGQGSIEYGRMKFDDTVAGFNFEGTYAYFSIFNPAVGYKWIVADGKGLTIDPSIGVNWKWEVAGKGDVDNRYIDNFVFQAGVKIGYSF
jgi:hypothetical protein